MISKAKASNRSKKGKWRRYTLIVLAFFRKAVADDSLRLACVFRNFMIYQTISGISNKSKNKYLGFKNSISFSFSCSLYCYFRPGSLEFLFEHKCVFKISSKEGVSLEDLELELIDYGVDEVVEDEEDIILYGEFKSYSEIQKYLEENGFEIHSAEFERIPNDQKELDAEQRAQIQKLLDKFEDDEDVQNVFHNMKEVDEEE